MIDQHFTLESICPVQQKGKLGAAVGALKEAKRISGVSEGAKAAAVRLIGIGQWLVGVQLIFYSTRSSLSSTSDSCNGL